MERDDVLHLKIPTFEFPWPAACSPLAEQVEQTMLQWGRSHRLVLDQAHWERVVRTRYGWLAARCYPHGDIDFLQAVADYVLWFFLADDLFVDRVDTITDHTITDLTAMIDVLDHDRLGAEPVYGETAWFDVCQRLRAILGPERFERFAVGMRMWASTAGLQILNHIRPQPTGITAYETIRRHTSGMNPCLALSDSRPSEPLSAEEFADPAVHRLRMHANNVVCWSNDIQSLMVEVNQPGQFRNMVTVCIEPGRSAQQAVDLIARRVRAEISAFSEQAREMEATANQGVRGYVGGLQHWMRGYQDWVEHDTERYLVRHVPTDADDRGIL